MTAAPPSGKRVLVFGASGTIGQAVVHAFLGAGHDVTAFIRPQSDSPAVETDFGGAQVRTGFVTDPNSVAQDAFAGEKFDVVISCLASRTGEHDDAWLIDHQANCNILNAAKTTGTDHMILLSAICVQRPRLAFQHAKLAFEKELAESGLTYSIVRPTAFFKSLSGQIERVQRGAPFLLFGDGELTACKPISDADLGAFMAACVDDQSKHNAILPIGGPGPAITPKDQAQMLFTLTGQKERYRHLPLRFFDAIIGVLDTLGRVSKSVKAKAQYARIGRYYASESMLLLDQETGGYNAAQTPETGSDTLYDHYKNALKSGRQQNPE